MRRKRVTKFSANTSKLIQDNKEAILNAYKKSGLKGLGLVPSTKEKVKSILSFDDVVEQYNRGISKEEIQAWVWYKRSLGVPMTGWNKFYLPKSGEATEQVNTTRSTTIKDNHFRDIRTVPTGTLLGKFTGKEHEYSKGVKYIIYRDAEGLKYVLKDAVKISNSGFTTDPKALQDLVKKGALYYLDGEVLPLPIYAYGNMYDRELQLIKDKEFIIEQFGKDVFEKHEKVIQSSKPELLTITSPDPKMRPIITCISDFANDTNMFSIMTVREEFMDLEKADELKKVNGKIERKKTKEKIDLNFNGESSYSLVQVFIKWIFTLNADQDFKKSSAIDIADYYINGRPLRDDKLSADQKAEIKSNARNEGEELFARFLNEVLTFEDQQKLDYRWNREYNGYSDVSHMRIPIGFECSAKFKSGILQITPIQREGVAFQQAVGSGINAFDVGVGKTMTAIVNAANTLYSGQAKRILLVVPKPTYQKWINEIIGFTDRKTKEFVAGVLSNTQVTLNEWSNLGTDIIKKLGKDLNKAVAANSITLVTYEGFKKIGFSEKIMDEMLDELVNILGQSNEGATARDKELDYQKYREMIGVGVKGTACDIDTLGFDYIIIDEAHRCKNVFSSVKADDSGKKRYSMTGATSETGIKAFFLCNYIQRKFGKNGMLLTATPFTNSPIEIYSMLSLVGYESMKNIGILNMDSFFDLFILPTTEWTANYKEEIVEKEVVKSFTNRNILQRLIHNHILYKTGEEAGVKRPCKVNLPRVNTSSNGKQIRLKPSDQILTYLKMTPKQRENQNSIVSLAKNATAGKLDMGALFKAISYSLDNALSPFLYKSGDRVEDYKEFIENSPKIHYTMDCIKSVKQWHEKRKEVCSGQVIYMNRGKAFFPFIKEWLEKEVGFKKGVIYDKVKVDEVEVISSEISDTRKETIKEAFLDGVVKVIIGTATIREGIDLQKKGTVIYNLYPEWNPTDIRQLEGRIWRQGNKFGFVRIVMPLVQDSMDVFVFQKLEEKTARINDIWFKGSRGNVLDLEALDPQEVKLALITDIDRLVKMFFDQEKEELEKDYRKVQNAITLIKEIKYDIDNYKGYREKSIALIDSFYNSLSSNSIFDKSIDERVDAAQRKDRKDLRKKAQDLLDAIRDFKESSSQEDKEILAICRKVEGFRGLNIYISNSYVINYFKEYVSKVRKTERNILKPKGYDINGDLEKLIDLYNQDLGKLLARVEDYKSADNQPESSKRWEELREEIREKKSVLAIDGKDIGERVEDFKKLNYLLAFQANEVDNNACELPNAKQQTDKQPKKLAEDSLINELELEAIALELELELLDF